MGTGSHPAAALAGPSETIAVVQPHPATGREEPFPERRFSQLHVEVVRNATGDFNPFHDARRWRRIHGNPFGAPIVLGFQLEMFMAHAVALQRREEGVREDRPFVSYRFAFHDVVRVNEPVRPEVRPTRHSRADGGTTSNRVFLRKDGRVVVTGRVECRGRRPRGMALDFRPPVGLCDQPDRAHLAGGRFFLKRCILQRSDAKNFLAGSQVPVGHYFDELEGRARFPELFPLSLVSSALLERAASEGYDFLRQPLVYTAHEFHVDRELTGQLSDGEALHILVEGPLRGLRNVDRRYRCYGLLSDGSLLFVAGTRLAPLAD